MSEKDMEEKEGLYIPRRLMELDSHPIEGNNELYIARDLAVNKIAYDRAFSMELKYDIEIYMKPFKNCKKLEEILSENIEKIKVKKQKIVMSFSDKDKSNNRNMGR